MNKVVSQQEWLNARMELLKREKEFDKQRDELSALRRKLPWVKVEKNYKFTGPSGVESLKDLFEGRSQLLVYHFMLGPTWEAGCTGCSFMMDNLPAQMAHLEQKDLRFVAVARAPLERIEAFRKRMGWDSFKWVSSFESDFNFDYQVSHTKEDIESKKAYYNYGTTPTTETESPGLSVFALEGGNVYHTYSTYARGLDMLINTYHYLDLTPKGRDEKSGMDWVKRHDEYGKGK